MIEKGRLNSNAGRPRVLRAWGTVMVSDALYAATNVFIPLKMMTLLTLINLSSFAAAWSPDRHHFRYQELRVS